MNLPIAPIAAAVLGVTAALGVAMTPTPVLEALVMESGIPAVLAAAEPPLGMTARLILASGIGGLVTLFSWFAMFLVLGTRGVTVRGAETQAPDMVPTPVVRRADAHPDAPPRPPLLATRDLGTPFLDVRARAAEAPVEEAEELKPLPISAPVVRVPSVPEPVMTAAPVPAEVSPPPPITPRIAPAAPAIEAIEAVETASAEQDHSPLTSSLLRTKRRKDEDGPVFAPRSLAPLTPGKDDEADSEVEEVAVHDVEVAGLARLVTPAAATMPASQPAHGEEDERAAEVEKVAVRNSEVADLAKPATPAAGAMPAPRLAPVAPPAAAAAVEPIAERMVELVTPVPAVAQPASPPAPIVLPPEQDLPRDLDQPLAAFDPGAIPDEPAPLPEAIAPLRRAPRPAVFDSSERFETFELTPPRPAPKPEPTFAPRSSDAITAPETEATIHALLERLEKGVVRRGLSPEARRPRDAERGLEDALVTLRNLARRAS